MFYFGEISPQGVAQILEDGVNCMVRFEECGTDVQGHRFY